MCAMEGIEKSASLLLQGQGRFVAAGGSREDQSSMALIEHPAALALLVCRTADFQCYDPAFPSLACVRLPGKLMELGI